LISFTIRDFIWIGSLVVTVALAYGRLRQELRHLEDTKADRKEVVVLSNELQTMLSDIRATLARLEEAIHYRKWCTTKKTPA